MFCIHTLFSAQGIFTLAALIGSLFFILKVLLLLFGAGSHLFHLDLGDSHDHHIDHDSDSAFKSISITSLFGFLMMFGWVGLAAYVQHSQPLGFSLILATLSGVLLSIISTLLITGSAKFINPGTVFNVHDAIGKRGTVYQTIPAHGQGRITVTIDDISREIDAISHDHIPLPSFTSILVIAVINSELVSVKKSEK